MTRDGWSIAEFVLRHYFVASAIFDLTSRYFGDISFPQNW